MRKRERLDWLGYWKSRVSQRGFWSSQSVIQKPSPFCEQDTKEREKKEKNPRAKAPARNHPLANALVPKSRRIRSKRTFERRSLSSNVPFIFLFERLLAFSYNTSLSCARKCTRKIPLQVFSSLPQKREKFRQPHTRKHAYTKNKIKNLYPKRVHRANVYRVRKLRY